MSVRKREDAGNWKRSYLVESLYGRGMDPVVKHYGMDDKVDKINVMWRVRRDCTHGISHDQQDILGRMQH